MYAGMRRHTRIDARSVVTIPSNTCAGGFNIVSDLFRGVLGCKSAFETGYAVLERDESVETQGAGDGSDDVNPSSGSD